MPQLKDIYNNHLKLLQKCITRALATYYNQKLYSSSHNFESTWKTLNGVLRPNREHPTLKLQEQATIIAGPTE